MTGMRFLVADGGGYALPAALAERPVCPCGGRLTEDAVWDGWGYVVSVACASCGRATRGVGPLLAEARRDAWHAWLTPREPGEE